MRRLALAALLGLAACHGQQGPGVTLDADEDARNATGAKIDADLAAADATARKPLPQALPDRTTGDAAPRDRDRRTEDANTERVDQDPPDDANRTNG